MLRPFFILLFSSSGLAFGASAYLLNLYPFTALSTLFVLIVPAVIGVLWLLLKLLAGKTDLVDRFGSDLMAFSYFTILLGPPVGVWYHWENAHTILYIDNGLKEDTTFDFENWERVTVSANQMYRLNVPIATLKVRYNGKVEEIPVRDAKTVIFNPDGIYNYAQYDMVYGRTAASSFASVEVLKHPRFVATNADYIFQAPPKSMLGASSISYIKRKVFTRIDNYTMKRYEKYGKRPRVKDLTN